MLILLLFFGVVMEKNNGLNGATKEKKPMGRPTKFIDNTISKVLYYLKNWQKYNKVPSVAGLADYLGIHKDTVYRMGEKK